VVITLLQAVRVMIVKATAVLLVIKQEYLPLLFSR
jgi:hypothetical protein